MKSEVLMLLLTAAAYACTNNQCKLGSGTCVSLADPGCKKSCYWPKLNDPSLCTKDRTGQPCKEGYPPPPPTDTHKWVCRDRKWGYTYWTYGPWSECNGGQQTRSKSDCLDNRGEPECTPGTYQMEEDQDTCLANNCPAVKDTQECVACYSNYPAAAEQTKKCDMDECQKHCEVENKKYSLVSFQPWRVRNDLTFESQKNGRHKRFMTLESQENNQCKFSYWAGYSVKGLLDCSCADELPSDIQTACFKKKVQKADQAHYYRTSLNWRGAWENIRPQTAEFSTVDGWDGKGCPKYQQFMATCADKCSSPSVEDTAAICGEFKACLADLPAEVKALAMEGCPASTGSSALNASAAYLVGPSALVLLLLQVALLAR